MNKTLIALLLLTQVACAKPWHTELPPELPGQDRSFEVWQQDMTDAHCQQVFNQRRAANNAVWRFRALNLFDAVGTSGRSLRTGSKTDLSPVTTLALVLTGGGWAYVVARGIAGELTIHKLRQTASDYQIPHALQNDLIYGPAGAWNMSR